jgi:hypothetical protein
MTALTEGLTIFDMQKKVWGTWAAKSWFPGSSSKKRNTGATTTAEDWEE